MYNSPSLEMALVAVNNELRQAIHQKLQQLGITLSPPQTQLLVMINEQPGICAQTLAKRSGRDKAMITRLLGPMIDSQWLTRVPDPEDGRRQLLGLTETGQQLLTLSVQARSDAYQTVFSPLTDVDKNQLVQLLEKCLSR